MKIMITGAAGQIGTDLIPALLADGHEVATFDLAPRPEGCPPEVEWIRGDVSLAPEFNEAVKRFAPDRLVHMAAILSAAGESIPHRAYRVNMEGLHNALEAARLFDVTQVFFTSTIAVFGPGLPDCVGDDVPLRPTTMYGITKAFGERLGEYYQSNYGIDFRGVRFPGLISAGTPGGGTSDYALFMYVEGLRNGAYEAFCSPASCIPFMYMPDALRAMQELMDAPKEKLKRCIYNIAAMSPTAQAFADAVKARLPEVQLTFNSDPKLQAILDSWPRELDDANARREWNWRHEFDLDAMSDDLIPKVRALIEAEGDIQPVGV